MLQPSRLRRLRLRRLAAAALALLACACGAPGEDWRMSPSRYAEAKQRVQALNRERDPEAVYRTEILGREIPETGIRGALVIHGGGTLGQETIRAFTRLAGGPSGRLVVVPTAHEAADSPEYRRHLAAEWSRIPFASVQVLHARSRAMASSEELLAPLREATAVWFGGGWHGRLAETYVGTPFEAEIHALLQRGGVVGGSSAGAGIQSRFMLVLGERSEALTAVGLDLFPGAVVDQHFSQRGHARRLGRVIESHRALYGVGIDEATSIVVQGRDVRVLGAGTVTLMTPAESKLDVEVLRSGQSFDLVDVHRRVTGRPAPSNGNRPVTGP